ncbi:hypothetical protein FE257_002500 [Aspergillus nanangensis]|uniref:P-loop containing nucleoside triphosphate hydrolase protein n=1 Tax=Aspergillus nanangensis TaxID=2582783 RepID=A0AAD4GVV4_ASPNN|nr:hypothetical protein FE257_002500 [Aspergillus nanangensis]
MDLLESWIYNVPSAPRQTRTQPLAVLALGMSRSGTESLRRALTILGYNHVYHGFDIPESNPPTWKAWVQLGRRKWGQHESQPLARADFDALMNNCDAVTDQPGALFASELIREYPEALVILNKRDPEAWHRSIRNTFGVTMAGFAYRVLPYFDAQLYWRKRYYVEVLEAAFYGSIARHGQWVYEDHCAKVRGMVPAERLLEWTVQDGWAPLCQFLQKPIPEQEFPSGNIPPATLGRIGAYMDVMLKRARRNLALTLVMLLGVSIAMVAT